jgi:hypothetical protein
MKHKVKDKCVGGGSIGVLGVPMDICYGSFLVELFRWVQRLGFVSRKQVHEFPKYPIDCCRASHVTLLKSHTASRKS